MRFLLSLNSKLSKRKMNSNLIIKTISIVLILLIFSLNLKRLLNEMMLSKIVFVRMRFLLSLSLKVLQLEMSFVTIIKAKELTSFLVFNCYLDKVTFSQSISFRARFFFFLSKEMSLFKENLVLMSKLISKKTILWKQFLIILNKLLNETIFVILSLLFLSLLKIFIF